MAADPTRLLARLDEFTAFARKRLGDADLAAEAVQESFLKALGHADQLDDDERVVAWFYRILRNVIVDLQRRRGSAGLDDGMIDPLVSEADTAVACRPMRSYPRPTRRRSSASPAGSPGQCRVTVAGPARRTTDRSTRATRIASSA